MSIKDVCTDAFLLSAFPAGRNMPFAGWIDER